MEGQALLDSSSQPLLDAPKPAAPRGQASRHQIALNVVGTILYPIAAPYAMGQLGWYCGTVVYFLTAGASYYATLILAEMVVRRPDLSSYPALGKAAFGPWGGIYTSVMQWVGFFALTVYNLVMIGEYLSVLMPGYLCQTSWLLVTAGVLAVPAQIRTWTDLSGLAMVFLCFTIVTTVLLVLETSGYAYCDATYDDVNFSSFWEGTTAFAFIWGGSGLFPEMIQEMKDPREFLGPTGSLTLAYSVIVPVYAIACVFGFWAYGNEVDGNLIENYPGNTIRKVTLLINLFVVGFGTLSANMLLAGKLEDATGLKVAVADEWIQRSALFGGVRVAYVRTTMRLLLIAAELLFAEMLFDSGVGDIQSFTGAVAGVVLTFVLPLLFYVKLFPDDEWSTGGYKHLLYISVAVFLVVAVVGTVIAVMDIAEDASEFKIFEGVCTYTISDTGSRCSLF